MCHMLIDIQKRIWKRGSHTAGMIHHARMLNPGIDFRVSDMLDLDIPDDCLGGIAALYSVIHVPPDRLGDCFEGLHRVLRPSGYALISFHVGDETVHLEEWWG